MLTSDVIKTVASDFTCPKEGERYFRDASASPLMINIHF